MPETEPSLIGSWRPAVAEALRALIAGARPDDYCVFDFDNTVLCEDIGEAAHARLSLDGAFDAALNDPRFSPPVKRGEDLVGASELGAVAYYEALAEDGDEPAAYAWIVEALAGLSPAAVLRATELARLKTADTPALAGPGFFVARPFVRPEVASLIEALRRAGLRVFIVSASNVWSVRAMVRAALDPLLSEPFPAGHIFAVSTLLREPDGALIRDEDLLRRDAAYRALDLKRCEGLTLTARLAHPMPAFEGKVAVIRRSIEAERRPLLVAGDSANDLSMLRYAEHRLLFARIVRPQLQRELRGLIGAEASSDPWMIQPVSQGPAGRLHAGGGDLAGLSAEAAAAWAAWNLG